MDDQSIHVTRKGQTKKGSPQPGGTTGGTNGVVLDLNRVLELAKAFREVSAGFSDLEIAAAFYSIAAARHKGSR